MNEVLTVRILRPNFDGLSQSERRTLADKMGKDIAEQILVSEDARKRKETAIYWQQRMLEWKIEDLTNELKYGKKPE